jgi:hypothetical protein
MNALEGNVMNYWTNIDSIDGHEFEDLVDNLIKRMGFITDERKPSADGGIDIKAINENPILRGKYIIQCKRYSKPIGVSTIRELFGVVTSEKANKGILITNSTFTQSSKEFAYEKPIELIDGANLVELLNEYIGLGDYEKINQTECDIVNIPEAYVVTYRIIKSGIEKIRKRRESINSKIFYLRKKEIAGITYIDFVLKKLSVIQELIQVYTNQINHLNSLWINSIDKGGNYESLREIKSFSNEIVITFDLIEKEWEDFLSTKPEDIYSKLYVNYLDLYNHILDKIESFINEFTKLIEASKEMHSKEDIKVSIDLILDVPPDFINKNNFIFEEINETLNPQTINRSSGCVLPILLLIVVLIYQI